MSFCIVLYIKTYSQLFFISLVFIILPYLMSCIVCIYWIISWNHWKYDHPYRLKNYLKSYEILIILLTLFGGFYSSIDLLQSKLFYLRATYFPLKIDEYNYATIFYINMVFYLSLMNPINFYQLYLLHYV